ncbi:RidA family protein [Aquicoccus sp. SCR17]|nr:RidA family protein [Carideicomes alvinocaridis]
MTCIAVNPQGWKKAKGYSNGMMAEGKTLFIGGQIGWNADQVFEVHDFVGQTRQALLNIRAVVEEAGGSVADISRLTWYVIDKQAYLDCQSELGAAYREVMGYHFPAMTLVIVAGLVEDEAQVEIEATAVLTDAGE